MTKKGTNREDAFMVGTVWAVPLCDPHEPVEGCACGVALMVARAEPFKVGRGRALMFGYGEMPESHVMDAKWFQRAPSVVQLVFTYDIPEMKWARVATIEVAEITIPKFKTLDDYGRWRNVSYYTEEVSTSGREYIITDAEAEGRACSGLTAAFGFQYALYHAAKLGWKWAPPKEVVMRGYQVVEHLL